MPFLRTVITLWWGFGVVHKMGVFEFSTLLVPECCPLIWGFRPLIRNQPTKIYVISLDCLELVGTEEVNHVLLVLT